MGAVLIVRHFAYNPPVTKNIGEWQLIARNSPIKFMLNFMFFMNFERSMHHIVRMIPFPHKVWRPANDAIYTKLVLFPGGSR